MNSYKINSASTFVMSERDWTQGGIHWAEFRFNSANYHDEYFALFNVCTKNNLTNNVTAKRKAEFLAGRYAAKKCFERLGFLTPSPFALSSDLIGCPLWPKNIVGSISHCHGVAMCAISTPLHVKRLGIDIELYPTTQDAELLAKQVHTQSELTILTRYGFASHLATAIIFSAKESIFKAYYPEVSAYFGFECVQLIDADPANGQLYFKLLHVLEGKTEADWCLVNFKLQEEEILTWVH